MRCESIAFFFAAALALLVPAGAMAQSPSILVLPWSLEGRDPASLAARAEGVTGAISSREGAAIAIADARRRFEDAGSAEPPSLTDGDLDRWLALSRQAVRQLASGDYAGAATTLTEAEALSEPATAELNRQDTRARQVLDTCLFDVRRLIETSDPRAPERALACRRASPRVSPSPFVHTPETVELLQHVDAHLAASPPGTLRLESEPSGCSVRFNGIPVGTTPFVSEDLVTGDYRAQIECGDLASAQRGRVHRIRLGEGASTVRIDVRFDAAVHTDTALRLSYASEAEAEAHRLEDGLTAAGVVGANEVWLVAIEADDGLGDAVRIDRVRVADGQVLATVRARTARLPYAVQALVAERSEDQLGQSAVAMEHWGRSAVAATPPTTTPPPGVVPGRADWEIGVGLTLGALAIGGYVTSFVLLQTEMGYGHLATQPLATDLDYFSRRRQWTDWELPVMALGWAGGALGIAALPFLMSDEDGTPWWSWVIGGAGVAVIAAGVAIALTSTGCGIERPTDACVGNTAMANAGSTIASMGAPLFAVPFVYLLREAVGGSSARTTAGPISIGASASLDAGYVSVGGAW